MTILAENTVNVNADITSVYNYITNMENYGNWFPGVIKIVSANNLEHAVAGKKYLETLELPQGISTLTIEVKIADPNHIFITEADFQPLLPRMTILFSDEGCGKSRVDWRIASRNREFTQDTAILSEIKLDLNNRSSMAMTQLKTILDHR